ncbi:sodium/potassium/calcium exchanger Nckx30C-like [Culicoides brevitarsis]|uniref:sodium/potassium/calcium exchanger Nckx30C-like n=1 Tax=Culicoides brevitarsis TaxID=469753 RepID=UPI00307BA692
MSNTIILQLNLIFINQPKNSRSEINFRKLLPMLSVFLLVLSSNFVACDNENYTDKDRERLLHSYHNIVIKSEIESSNITGILPFLGGFYHTVYHALNNSELVREEDCEPPSAINDFPGTIFPEDSLLKGAVIFHILAAIYFLSLLAVVCGSYFIPSVECICEDLHLSTDVAAATFMATATTMPEFFTNTISTFVTDSDLGIGAIIGSMLFNTLGVSGLAALASRKSISIEWWSISRDALLFAIHISLLVAFAFDGVIVWYEATVFVILYVVYFTIMFQNKRISKYVKPFLEKNLFCFRKTKIYDIDHVQDVTVNSDSGIFDKETSNSPTFSHTNSEIRYKSNDNGCVNKAYTKTEDENTSTGDPEKPFSGHLPVVGPHIIEDEDLDDMTLWKLPWGRGSLKWFLWIYSWPIRCFCTCLIPNPKTYRSLYPLTFIMCMIVLAANSYMVVWMVTVIGFTFKIPESVMGLTFLAAGGCLPEAFSAVIMARKGDGALGISNSLGSNSLAVLFSLGFPWFLRIMVDKIKGEAGNVIIYNNGLEFTIIILLLALTSLYIIISCTGFRLTRTVGFILLFFYTVFVTIGILMNMGLLFSFIGGPISGEC